MLHTKRRIAIIATSTAAVLLGAGAAVAYWTTTGGGTGSASVGAAGSVTVTQTSTNTGLFPGGPASTLTFTVHNTGTSPVTISNIGVSIDPTSLPTGCTAGDFNISTPLAKAVSVGSSDVAQSAWGGYSIAMNETGQNQDACQNANLKLVYAAS